LDEKHGQSQENPLPNNPAGGLGVQPHCRGGKSGGNTQPGGGGFSLNRNGRGIMDIFAGNRETKEVGAWVYLKNCLLPGCRNCPKIANTG